MAENVELVIVRRGDDHSVLHGRCLHRGALLADGHVQGDDLICGLHGWDYRIESGVSAYNNAEALAKFDVGRGGRRAVRRSRRRDPVEAHASAAVQPRRVPGSLHGSARNDRRAVRDAHPRARGARPREGRPPRIRRRDGRAAPATPHLGRHPVRDRRARAAAAARRRTRRRPRCASARTRASRSTSTSRCSCPTCRSARCRRKRRPRSRGARSSRAPASARARAGCSPKSRPRTRATSTSSRRRASAGRGTC